MTRQLEAVYQGGQGGQGGQGEMLRPLQPLNLLEDQKVLVTVATFPATNEEAFLDEEFHRYCESRADYSITLEQVRSESTSIPGSLADQIIADRRASLMPKLFRGVSITPALHPLRKLP